MFQCRHCNRTSDRFNPYAHRCCACDSRNYRRVIVRIFILRPMEVLHGKFMWGIIKKIGTFSKIYSLLLPLKQNVWHLIMQLIASNFLWKFEPDWPISSFTIGKYIHFWGTKQFSDVKLTLYCTLLFWNYDTLWEVFCVFVKYFMSYLMCLKIIIMHWIFP